jgi:hypothetical protein
MISKNSTGMTVEELRMQWQESVKSLWLWFYIISSVWVLYSDTWWTVAKYVDPLHFTGLSPLWCRNWTMPCILGFSAITSPHVCTINCWSMVHYIACNVSYNHFNRLLPFAVLCPFLTQFILFPQAHITQIFLIGALFSDLRIVKFPQRMICTWSSPQIVSKGLWWAMPREVPRNCIPCSDVKTWISSFDVFRIKFLFAIESVHSSESNPNTQSTWWVSK